MGLVFASTSILSGQNTAQAFSINFEFAEGTSLEQQIGFKFAERIWEYYLDDDDTDLNIAVGVYDFGAGSNIIGGAIPSLYEVDYEDFVDALCSSSEKSSSTDNIACANLPSNADSNGYYGILESGSSYWNDTISLTTANARALGLLPSDREDDWDGVILMSDLNNYSSLDWSYDYLGYQTNSSIPHNTLDFLTVALHEIGHLLGFVNGADAATSHDRHASSSTNTLRLDGTFALDMFRFSDFSTNSYGNNVRELALGEEVYFSIDGGNTRIADFSRGRTNLGLGSDGFQTSHWEVQSNSLGIMDPDLAIGERGAISGLDLMALDAIGWDLEDDGLDINYWTRSAYLDEATIDAESADWGQIESALDSILAGDIYQRRRGGSASYHSEVDQAFLQEAFMAEGYWSGLDEESESIPEASSTLGLLSFGIFGLLVGYKRPHLKI